MAVVELNLEQNMQSTYMTVVYCDGSWLSSTKTGGFGIVVWKGEFIEVCSAGSLSNYSCALEAEIHDIDADPKLAKSMTYGCIQICSDSVGAIWASQSGKGVPEDSSKLAKHGMNLLSCNSSWDRHRIMREDNRLAEFVG